MAFELYTVVSAQIDVAGPDTVIVSPPLQEYSAMIIINDTVRPHLPDGLRGVASTQIKNSYPNTDNFSVRSYGALMLVNSTVQEQIPALTTMSTTCDIQGNVLGYVVGYFGSFAPTVAFDRTQTALLQVTGITDTVANFGAAKDALIVVKDAVTEFNSNALPAIDAISDITLYTLSNFGPGASAATFISGNTNVITQASQALQQSVTGTTGTGLGGSTGFTFYW